MSPTWRSGRWQHWQGRPLLQGWKATAWPWQAWPQVEVEKGQRLEVGSQHTCTSFAPCLSVLSQVPVIRLNFKGTLFGFFWQTGIPLRTKHLLGGKAWWQWLTGMLVNEYLAYYRTEPFRQHTVSINLRCTTQQKRTWMDLLDLKKLLHVSWSLRLLLWWSQARLKKSKHDLSWKRLPFRLLHASTLRMSVLHSHIEACSPRVLSKHSRRPSGAA